MKKFMLLLLCVLMLFTASSYSQIIDESFEGGSLPPGWTTETISGNTWSIVHTSTYACDGSYTARYDHHNEQDADAWFFTSGVSLNAGTAYQLTFQYRARDLFYPERLRVMIGTSQSAAGMSMVLYERPYINTTDCREALIPICVPATGTYYLGFQCYSFANRYQLFVDDIVLDISPPFIDVTPNQFNSTACGSVTMNVMNYTGTDQSFTFSETSPASLAVSFAPVNPTIPACTGQDVIVSVTPIVFPGWQRIDFDITATGDSTGHSDSALFRAHPSWWTALADSNHGDFDVAAVSDGSYIYTFGGWNGNHLERYDPATDTWTDLASNPWHSRPSPTGACYVDGNIYLMNSANGDPGNMYRYHIATDTYHQIPLPVGVDYLGWGEIVHYRGNLYIMGSYDHSNGGSGRRLFSDIHFWKYNIAADAWREITSAPAEALRAGQGMVQKNGKIYIMGGQFYTIQTYVDVTNYEYNIAADSWHGHTLPLLWSYCINNKAWIVGSYLFVDDGGWHTNMWVYKLNDPAWTSWQAIRSMPIDQLRYGAAYQNGVLYATNGYRGSNNQMQAMKFCPLIANAGSGFCVCHDFAGSLDLGPLDGASAVAGSPGYTYAWSDGLGWTSSNPMPSYTVDPANLPITISLAVTDSIGSVDMDTVTIVSYPPLAVEAGNYAAVPPGSYTLGGVPAGTGYTADGGKPPYSYTWTCMEDVGWTSNLEHPTYTFSTTGSYVFSVTVTDDCGTVALDTVTIDCGDLQVRAGAHRVICVGDSTVLGGNPTASNGVPPYTYSWTSDPAGYTSTSPNPMVAPTVSTRYTVIVTDGMNPGGLTGTVQVNVAPYLAAPTMLQPPDGCHIGDPEAYFTWTDVNYKTGYKLHLADSRGHHWTFTTAANVTHLLVDASMGVLSRGETYTWWVQATSDGTYCDSQQIGIHTLYIDDLPEPVTNTLIFASDQVTKGDLSNTRTNLGMISLGSAYVNTHLTLRNANGTVLSCLDLPVGYNQYAAYTDLLGYFPVPYNEGSIDLESTDHIYMISGLVDNVTNDPSIYPQDSEQGDHIMTPIVLRTDDWKTQVVLRNLADEDLEVSLTTYVDTVGNGYPSKNRTITIPAQGYFKTDDIMAYMMDPHVYALLTAEVTGGSGHITGFARQLTSDNMGGIYPFYTVDGGSMAYVFPYVVDTAARRSNIGLVNTNANNISVFVQFVRDGYMAGSKSYAVGSYSYLPIANVIRDVTGTTGIQNTEGFLYLSASSYPFRVVGGPIDNISNDPSVFGGCPTSFTSGFTPLVLRSGPWTSRLVLTNPQAGDNVTVDLVLYQNGEPVGTITRTINARNILVIDDIIGEFTSEDLFGSLFIYASNYVFGFVEQTTGPGGASGVYPVFELP